ncbi:MAG: acyl-CoA thioesterase [Segetibacter sp.]|nr:acyl-CoA thioesterase [Segetibacter sp.]
MDTTDFKQVSDSQTVLTELMVPSYTNFGGKIHGGVILSLMDKVAYVCATKHADAYCVTASIDAVDFLHPVEIGELVSLMASVNYVGNSSLVVGIRVVSENVKRHWIKHTNTSYFSMVALDDDHKPVKVPGLILQSPVEVRRFVSAIRRKELKKQHRSDIQRVIHETDPEVTMRLLANERCIVKDDVQ